MFDTCQIVHYFLLWGDGSRTIFTNFTPTRSQNRGWIGVACWGEFIDGAQPLGRTDSHLGSAGIGWVGAVSIGAEDGEGFGWHGDGYSGGCRGIDIGFAKKPTHGVHGCGVTKCVAYGEHHADGEGVGRQKPSVYPSAGIYIG